MNKNFKISLLENGLHSFNKGLDQLIQYDKEGRKDDFKLKEAIMFLHHGIELLLKQLLIKNGGEYLIFSNIDSNTVKKIIKAKKEGISVFNLKNPVHTATYIEVIKRVQAFIDSPQLEESLETKLIELNTLRNNIEHYGINTEKTKVDNLLLNLHTPITDFLTKAGINLGDELKQKWNEFQKQLLLEVSRLRAGGSIKKADLIKDSVNIEYVENFNDYQKLQPQSTVTKEQWESYWESGDALIKAIIDAGVRLMRKFDEINEARIKIPYKGNNYSIHLKRGEVENFVGYSFEMIRQDWDNTFSNRFVYSETGRKDFFNKFGKVNKK